MTTGEVTGKPTVIVEESHLLVPEMKKRRGVGFTEEDVTQVVVDENQTDCDQRISLFLMADRLSDTGEQPLSGRPKVIRLSLIHI